ncbi:MAG: amidophosphoribosyltransferase [Candidatus Marinimicrobia bacterium]|nr:amidophosphoribosyltransferase [Candidatus Neomarinimicrobiota bacterium]
MCGIVGIYNHQEAATLAYLSLYALQHRGQEGCGIVTFDGENNYWEKDKGLVPDVFADKSKLDFLKGNYALGHNRYSTHGDKSRKNIQPLVFNYKDSKLSIVHNGNLVNLEKIKKELEDKGTIFQTTSDTEYFIHLFAHARGDSFEEKALAAIKQVRGAFSIIMMYNEKMLVARDCHGIRPLCMGKIDEGYIFSSETCAMDLIGADYLREIEPGEMLILENGSLKSLQFDKPEPKHCIFEYVYFSRPDSIIFGQSVDKSRRKFGKILAMESPVADADIVFSVPDSSNTTAIGFSQRSEARYEIGLIRNHYIGRSFIHPSQNMRDMAVKLKFNTIDGVIKDKKIVIVDDSIVRGTTLKKLVKLVKKAGPREIHIRIGSPPVKYPCYYGMDFPSQEELIANQKTLAEIREHLKVDSIEYLSVQGLLDAVDKPDCQYCTACFTGDYIEKIQ